MIEIDLIRFTGGERKGQIGCLTDFKQQVFGLYDQNGDYVYHWDQHDVVADDNGRKVDGFDSRWLSGFELFPVEGVGLKELQLLAKVGAHVEQTMGHQVRCLLVNIGKHCGLQRPSVPDNGLPPLVGGAVEQSGGSSRIQGEGTETDTE